MAKFSNFANDWAKKIICSDDKGYTLNSIVHDMNHLVYSESKQPLTFRDKAVILRLMFDIFAGRIALQLKEGEKMSPQLTDITLFLSRKNFILKHLRAGVKKQAELN